MNKYVERCILKTTYEPKKSDSGDVKLNCDVYAICIFFLY